MIGPYESFYGIVFDMVLVFIFGVGVWIGWKRSVLESVVALVVQLLALNVAYLLANGVTSRVMAFVPSTFELSSYLPEEFQLFFKPYEPDVLPILMQLTFLIILFIVIKSFLWHFGQTYMNSAQTQTDQFIKKFILNSISSGVTVITTYTYLILLVIVAGFPGFEIVSTNSIANHLIERLPIFSDQVQAMYTKSEALEKVIMTYGQTTCDSSKEEVICLNDIILSVSLNEATWEDYINVLATTEGYLQFFNGEEISEVAMLEHVNALKSGIESNVVTKDLINLYYKELIDNETYDILIKNQIVTKPSLYVLLHSGLLNIENYNSLEEYL